jgi:hypothetical protein
VLGHQHWLKVNVTGSSYPAWPVNQGPAGSARLSKTVQVGSEQLLAAGSTQMDFRSASAPLVEPGVSAPYVFHHICPAGFNKQRG